MATSGWSSSYGTSDVATHTPCRCFFPLVLALEEPAGAVRIDPREPGAFMFGRVSLQVTPTQGFGLRHCPNCGGKVGGYRPEAFEAYALFRAARARYAGLDGCREQAEIEGLARANGATVVASDSGYHTSWRDPANDLEVTAAYDPDHERFYGSIQFSPSAALAAAPFLEGTL
jgi:hypothetical protein